jgi:GNAT superfamily N-acetyltransferase
MSKAARAPKGSRLVFMKLYSEYILERRNAQMLLIPETAFVAYFFKDDNIFISEMFVTKSERKKGMGKFLLEQIRGIAKAHGKKYITCTVDKETECSELSEKAVKAGGFKLLREQDNGLYFYQEV